MNIAIAAACAGLLVASLVGVAVVDDTDVVTGAGTSRQAQNDEAIPAEGRPDTGPASTAAAGGGGGNGDKPGQPGAGGTGTTAAPAGPTTAPPASAMPKRLAPPKAGTYKYDRTVNGRAAKVDTEKFETTSTAGGTTRQKYTVTTTEGGSEATYASDIIWNSAGVTLSRTVIPLAGGTVTCDWNPDGVEYPGDLNVGKEWSYDSSCSGKVEGGQFNGQNFKARRVIKRKVTGAKQEKVGDQTVPTWTVQFEERNEAQLGTVSQVTEDNGTEQAAAELGLQISRDFDRKVTAPARQPANSKQTRRIQTLTPA